MQTTKYVCVCVSECIKLILLIRDPYFLFMTLWFFNL